MLRQLSSSPEALEPASKGGRRSWLHYIRRVRFAGAEITLPEIDRGLKSVQLPPLPHFSQPNAHVSLSMGVKRWNWNQSIRPRDAKRDEIPEEQIIKSREIARQGEFRIWMDT